MVASCRRARPGERPSPNFGAGPSRNFASYSFELSVGEILVAEPSLTRPGIVPVPAKKAARPQKSSRVHDARGWLWHCAQPRRTPSRPRPTASATRSGLFPTAKKKPAGPGVVESPVAVSIARVT